MRLAVGAFRVEPIRPLHEVVVARSLAT